MEPLIRHLIRGLNRIGLRDIQLRGVLPSSGFVWAANHHSWWDGFAAAGALGRAGRTPTLLMDSDNLARFGYLRRAGAIGTDELRAAMRALRRGDVLIVFPEGELRAPGPPGALHRGAAWLARRSDTPLVPVATRAAMRAHQAPEYLIDVGPSVRTSAPDLMTEHLAGALTRRLEALDQLIATADPYAGLSGFTCLERGRRDWDERFRRAAVTT